MKEKCWIIRYHSETELFVDPRKGTMYLRNSVGHDRIITLEQQRELIMQAQLCGCQECIACAVLEMTLDRVTMDTTDERIGKL